jgi:hypothetical protein
MSVVFAQQMDHVIHASESPGPPEVIRYEAAVEATT